MKDMYYSLKDPQKVKQLYEKHYFGKRHYSPKDL